MGFKWFGPALALCLIVVASVASYGWFTAHSKLSQAKGTIAVLEASVQAYRASAADVQEVMQQHTANTQVINNALEANQDWAATAVPDAVIAGLCKNSNCQTGGMQTPGNQPKH